MRPKKGLAPLTRGRVFSTLCGDSADPEGCSSSPFPLAPSIFIAIILFGLLSVSFFAASKTQRLLLFLSYQTLPCSRVKHGSLRICSCFNLSVCGRSLPLLTLATNSFEHRHGAASDNNFNGIFLLASFGFQQKQQYR